MVRGKMENSIVTLSYEARYIKSTGALAIDALGGRVLYWQTFRTKTARSDAKGKSIKASATVARTITVHKRSGRKLEEEYSKK